MALSDVMSDPRFDRATAERTGYVPRSIAAVPLIDRDQTVGVLQVLDKSTTPTFTLKDMELLAVFATQAAAAIRAARVQRDSERSAARRDGPRGRRRPRKSSWTDLVSAAAAELDTDEDAPFWRWSTAWRRCATCRTVSSGSSRTSSRWSRRTPHAAVAPSDARPGRT